MSGKVKSESAPRARMAAMAVEVSSSSASMAPWVAMMAVTPQTLEPMASRVVSLGPRLKMRPSQVMTSGERTKAMTTKMREMPPSLRTSPRMNRAPSEDDADLEPELVGGYAGAEDARDADGVGDDDAEEDRPEDVLDVGEGDVVGFGPGVEEVSTNLPA